MVIERDTPLVKRLFELSEKGASAKLADLTDTEWDTVHVFFEGSSAEDIERSVGTKVIKGDFWYEAGNLMVFVNDGAVVSAVAFVPDILATNGKSSWGTSTWLEPRGDRKPAVLGLVEK